MLKDVGSIPAGYKGELAGSVLARGELVLAVCGVCRCSLSRSRDWNTMCSKEVWSFMLRVAIYLVFTFVVTLFFIHRLSFFGIFFAFIGSFVSFSGIHHKFTCCSAGRKEETSAGATVGSPSSSDAEPIHIVSDNALPLRRVPWRWSGREWTPGGGRPTSGAGEEGLSTGAAPQSTGSRGRHSSSAGHGWLVLRVELPPLTSPEVARLGPASADPGQDQAGVRDREQDPPPPYQQTVKKTLGACGSAAGGKEERPPPSYASATRKGPLRSHPKLEICNSTGDWRHYQGNSQGP